MGGIDHEFIGLEPELAGVVLLLNHAVSLTLPIHRWFRLPDPCLQASDPETPLARHTRGAVVYAPYQLIGTCRGLALAAVAGTRPLPKKSEPVAR
jgi:hypothetical protein